MANVRLFDSRGGSLPPICLCCGEPTTEYKRKKFVWQPSWVLVTFLCGLLPFLIVILLTRKNLTLRIPLCSMHQNHWSWRNQAIYGSLFFLVFVLVLGGIMMPTPMPDWTPFVVIGAIFSWLVVVVVAQAKMIRPIEMDADSVLLKGVSPIFRDRLREIREGEEYEEAEEEADDDYDMRGRSNR